MSIPKLRWIAMPVVCGVATLLTIYSKAQLTDPKTPMADEAMVKRLRESAALADRLLEQGSFGEAVRPAQEAATLAADSYGPKDSRAFDADRRLRVAETARDLPDDKRKALIDALQAEARAKGLAGSKPIAALKFALEAATKYATALGEETPEHARSWHLVGLLRAMTNDIGGSAEANLKALTIRRKTLPKDHTDIAKSLYNLGNAQFALRDYEGAMKSHDDALAIRRNALKPDDPLIAQSLSNRGVVQSALREFEAAKRSHGEALAIFRKALPEGHPDIADSLNNLGNAQYELRDYEGATKSHQQALEIRRKALGPDSPLVAQSLNNLGAAQHDLRDFEGAKESHEQALEIRRKFLKPDDPRIADSLNNLGAAQHDLRDYEGAKRSHGEALAIFRKALPEGHPDIADSLNNLGAAQRDLRDYEGALKSHEEALRIRRKSLKPDDPLIPQSLSNLGNVQHDLRDYEGARQSFESALAIFRKALKPDDPLIAQGLSNFGNVQDDLRDYEGAKKSHQEALEIRRKVLKSNDPGIAASLNNLGNAQHALRDYEGAMKSHDEALAIRRNALKPDDPLIAQSLSNRGNIQAALRDFEGAKMSYQEALEIRRKALPEGHPEIADSLHNLGVINLALGGPTAAMATHLSEALSMQQSNLQVLAGSQVEAEQFAAGLDAWKTLSLYLSAALASGPEADISDVYDLVGGLKGLVTARQRWTRELRDDSDLETHRLLDQLQMVNLRLLRAAFGSDKIVGKSADRAANPQVELARLDAERKELERQLATQSDAFRQYQKKAGLGGAAIHAALPPGCCLIDFLVYARVGPPPQEKADPLTELRVLAFVVRPGKEPVRGIDLAPADRIGALVDAWRERYVIRKPGKTGEADPATELRNLVWEPVEKYLGKPGVVLVSPDGPLNYLPLAALPGGVKDKFLVHEYGFAVVPAPVLLPDLMARKPARLNNASLLLVGGIDFGKENEHQPKAGKFPTVPTNWKALAWTSREVNDIQEQFKKAYPRAQAPVILEKDKATKDAFVVALPGSAYVHLATHGFFAAEAETSIPDGRRGPNPVRLDRAVSRRQPGVLSGLVFAGVNNPPGGAADECILTAMEARELDLRGAELVTMSACDTGSGRTVASEGVLGLQRSFQVAGARSVVATHWMVPDSPTRALMSEFYKRLWGKDLVSKAEALREAQVLMIEKWDLPLGDFRGPTEPKDDAGPLQPYFWAAFTIAGDWR